jgi:hypothetical protein
MAYNPHPNTQGPRYRYSKTFNPSGAGGPNNTPAELNTGSDPMVDSATGNYDPMGTGPGYKAQGSQTQNLGYGSGAPNSSPGASGTSNALGYIGAALSGEHGFKANAPVIRTGDFEVQRGTQQGVGGQQGTFGEYLRRAAMGQGPSAAQAQLMSGRDAAIKASAAQAAGARGAASPLAQRAAAFSQAGSIQQAARDAGILRAQEQNQAMQLANENLNQQRLAELQNQGMSAEMAKAQLLAESSALGNQTQIAEGTAERRGGFFADLLSDMRAKEDVQPVNSFGSALSRAIAEQSTPAPAPAVQQAPAYSPTPMEQPEQRAPEEGKSGIGAIVSGILSDRRAKELTSENMVLRTALQKTTGNLDRLEKLAQHSGYTPEDLDQLKTLGYEDRLKKLAGYSGYSSGDLRSLENMGKPKPKPGDAKLMAELEKIDRDTDPKPEKSPDLSTALARALGKVEREATGTVDTSKMPDFELPNLNGSVGRMPDVEESRANLDAVKPYTYRYKPEVAAAIGEDTGPREGVMAQDLQQSPSYQAAVVPGPGGALSLDPKRLLSANTAEIGGLDKRLKALEFGPALKRASGY